MLANNSIRISRRLIRSRCMSPRERGYKIIMQCITDSRQGVGTVIFILGLVWSLHVAFSSTIYTLHSDFPCFHGPERYTKSQVPRDDASQSMVSLAENVNT